MNNNSIPNHLLSRFAAVYVRQSTPQQVRNNTGSAQWQMDLKNAAVNLGWSENRVLPFEEMGASASIPGNREQFAELLRLIGEGRIGMVLMVEGTRASRNDLDWAELTDTCQRTDTWLWFDGRAYDPNNHSDRFSLGLNQVISVSLGTRQFNMLQSTKLAKAEKGEVFLNIPVGYDREDELVEDHQRRRLDARRVPRLVITKDDAVREALTQMFTLFDELGSAIAVAGHYRKHNLTLPRRPSGKEAAITWRVPDRNTILTILRNPTYAGAYTYRRHRRAWKFTPGQRAKATTVRVPRPEDWKVLHKDAHEGYITWEQYERNCERLRNNKIGHSVGAPREGTALLQGLAFCGVCGKKMTIAYCARGVASYRCDWDKRIYKGRLCQSVVGPPVERAVVEVLLEALTAAQVNLTVQATHQLEQQTRRDRAAHSHQLARLEQATSDAKTVWIAAMQRSAAREREHGLPLDSELLTHAEDEFKRAKAELSDYEKSQLQGGRRDLLVTPEQSLTLQALAENFRELWAREDLDNRMRKELLRSLIESVEIRKHAEAAAVFVIVHWHSGSCSPLVLGDTQYHFLHIGTPTAVIERVRELSKTHTSYEIACQLNAEGLRTLRRREFSPQAVSNLQRKHQIEGIKGLKGPNGYQAQLPNDIYSQETAAKVLGVGIKAIRTWQKKGWIDAEKHGHGKTTLVHLPLERIDALKALYAGQQIRGPSAEEFLAFEKARITDHQWQAIQHLAAPKLNPKARPSRWPSRERLVVDAMLWAFKMNVKWRRVPSTQLPPNFCLRIIQSWHTRGVLDEILLTLSEELHDESIRILRDRIRNSGSVIEAFEPRPSWVK